VDLVHDGEDGYDYASTGIYDAIVMDIMLPKMNGLEVTRKLRQNGMDTPIIMLTARDGVADKIAGLDAGADDYLAKPFVPDELLARIRSISRRQGPVVLNKIEFDGLSLNLSNYTLETESKSLSLGPKEFEIMRLLISSPNVIVPKEDILVKIWGVESEVEDNNVEVYISFLRKKIAKLTDAAQIATVRKIGYRLEVKE
ncbi:MAG TPA: response regulator transcription factor, partial [Clostridiales bacterium]|nr:response regulator transcription factor [Clostridiales bacterium]